MNKYLYIFGFAGVALFSACSNSDDLSIVDSSAVDKAKESVLIYEAGQDSEVPITLGIGQSRGYTRKPLESVEGGIFSTEEGKYLGVFCLAVDYQDENNQVSIQPCIGYKDIYLTFMEKISQNCSFCIIDDYSYFIHNENKHGKLFLIDPYDVDTLQIFFDIELDKYPEKIDVINVVTQKKLSKDYYMNKYVVNVEPIKAVTDINYFLNKIEQCIHNRKSELIKMQSKDIPIMPNDEELNYEQEMIKLPGDVYLEMTILPLLQNAINMCDMIRPPDPITFIANFMLMNKDKAKNLEDIIKELPKKSEKKDKKVELMINDEIEDEKFEEEKIEEEKKEENIEEAKEDDKAKAEEENKKKEAAKKSVEGSKKGKAKPTSKGKK
jgi:hypothetical protein